MSYIKLTITYDGTNYHGWQVQESPTSKVQRPKLKTIQGILEETLSKITEESIKVTGSGRTDAGVHALGQVANFSTRSRMTPGEFKKALNSMLPGEIRIREARCVKKVFHAQFRAKGKHYRYIIYQGPTLSPFLKDYACYISHKLDLEAMEAGAKYLIGKHDFSSFQLSGSSARNPVRTVTKLSVVSQSDMRYAICDMRKNDLVIFVDIEANGFLYGMVRSMVGTLIEVGRGKIAPAEIKEILQACNRGSAGPTASARGLYLVSVKY